MEFTLDLALVRRILAEESARARRDIGASGPFFALRESQDRHTARLAAAEDAGSLACREGCDWCCHFSVDVRAVEVFAIETWVSERFSAVAQAGLRERVQRNLDQLEVMKSQDRDEHTLACPFLEASCCSIYPVRPQSCRNYHATDARGCAQSFAEPGNDEIDPEFAPLVYQTGTAHVEGFSNAMRDGGYDTCVYELNAALAAAWGDPDARARWSSGQAPFAELAGVEVGAEYDDLV